MPNSPNAVAVPECDLQLDVKEMMENGVHFGHHVSVRHPAMRPFILGVRNDIVIIDVSKTIGLFKNAMSVIEKVVKNGKPVLFVGTKKFAKTIIKDVAEGCGEPFVNHRWLGGFLTNSGTINLALKRLVAIEDKLNREDLKLKKKERVILTKEADRLRTYFGGCRNMVGKPGALVVLDVGVEDIAVAEARKMGIPVIGIVDTNTDPKFVGFPIPANDDSMKSISFLLGKIGSFIDLVKETHFGISVNEEIIGEDALNEKHGISAE